MEELVEYKSDLICGTHFSLPLFKDGLKSYFNKLYFALINDFGELNNVEKVIITDDFINEVISLQRKLEYNISVTNNEYGRAYGKVLRNKQTKKFYIILDSEIASYIVDDTMFETIINSLGEDELRKNLMCKRRIAINIFYHELSHIEMDAKFEYARGNENNIKNYISSIAYRLFQEYYASRRSGEFYGAFSINSDSKKGEIKKIEQEIWNIRRKYN